MPPRGNRGGGGGGDAGTRGAGPPARGARGAGPRGVGRGGPAGRGAPASRGGPVSRGGPAGRGGGGSAGGTASAVAAHVESIGVKRPNHGGMGRVIPIITNHYATDIPDNIIYHYDVISSEKTLPIGACFDIIKVLQNNIAPNVFTPRGAYDGRKNMFSSQRYNFENDTATFDVTLSPPSSEPALKGRKGPKVYKVTLKKVAEINPEVLHRYLKGQQSMDNTVQTAITALNVVIRMAPSLQYPFNVRSFFTPAERSDIGSGIVLWRGYFQSIRPAIGRMLTNVDISTGAMYKDGPLLTLCLDVLGRGRDAGLLAPRRGLPDRARLAVQRFIQNIKVETKHGKPAAPGTKRAPRTVKKLTKEGARDLTFKTDTGASQTVAAYFQGVLNRPLQYPDVVCAELSTGALIPLELCTVIPGQIIRKQLPPEKTKDVLDFSTKQPPERLASIRNGLSVLAYGQSEYVRQFGMTIEPDLLQLKARVMDPPTLQYGAKSKQKTIRPRDGAWNMIDKQMYIPANTIEEWVVVVYETQRRFDDARVNDMIGGLRQAADAVGVPIRKPPALVKYLQGSGDIIDQMVKVGGECRAKTGKIPSLFVVILPEAGNDIYSAVKFFGDILMGVPTQCMKAHKCSRAKQQYYANVLLKLNVKLGGVNTVPEPRSVSFLSDPANPTLILGADVVHPAPGSDGRPSFTAVVGNVDSDSAKYVATMRVQEAREEIIQDLEEMVTHILTMYKGYQTAVEKKANPAPKRIIFYRDGVSEGQFRHVLERELPLIQKACAAAKINPKITMIIVGKRHHVRFFPTNPGDADRSKNCPAGTVVDTEVVSPVEFDFYLQSHGGLLGTSRPAHYNVLHDENNFSADGLQSLSFALTHVYARSTRSVSIPAPVYYADIVCARAKHHYDPRGNFELTQTLDETNNSNNTDAQRAALEKYRKNFQEIHKNISKLMYFC